MGRAERAELGDVQQELETVVLGPRKTRVVRGEVGRPAEAPTIIDVHRFHSAQEVVDAAHPDRRRGGGLRVESMRGEREREDEGEQ
jgi:hypothetical protein